MRRGMAARWGFPLVVAWYGTALGAAVDTGLRDQPIAGHQVVYLAGEGDGAAWTATSSSGLSIAASVPGDLLTDLQRSGHIGDPLYEINWLNNSSLWDKNIWTYKTQFQLPEVPPGGRLQLVFDGIKMGATVLVNGVSLGLASSQFLRYVFDLDTTTHRLQPHGTTNTLEVSFDPTTDCDGRFMACTGGWDWAPYTDTKLGGARTFTKGIWKHVYLLVTVPGGAAITHVVPQIAYNGPYPTAPLEDGAHSGFKVDVRVFLSAPVAITGELSMTSSWGAALRTQVQVKAGETAVVLSTKVSAQEVKLWWPAGMGDQPLYSINVTFKSGSTSVSTARRVGFRYFALVTGNDTDPGYVAKAAQEEGTESHGMLFRINGAVMWSRGANMIPMEELEGRLNAQAHRVLVQSARDANFNTLRVWGGGMFLPDAWYDACDELGLIVYHDMQYAQEGHSPAATTIQDAELRHQIRRLSAHPAIVIWDGCNECQVIMDTDTAIYATFVMTVVAQEDQTRAVWPSCPAKGWTTGVQKLDSRPNGKTLTTPKDGKTIEVHGEYLHGGGFPAVNGDIAVKLFDAGIPAQLADDLTGPQYSNIFVSEFGAVTMSSFESMSVTLAKEHWALHAGQPLPTCSGSWERTCDKGNVMAQRNYPCDNIIDVYFGKQTPEYFNTTGEVSFKKQVYQCLIGQALYMKSYIETARSKNQFGCLVWQFNEIWPTGGWGSVEYGTPVPGQVLGGRWKPLHYFYQQSLYADVMATCGVQGKCYVKNDARRPFEGNCSISSLDFASGELRELKHLSFAGQAALPAGAGVKFAFSVDLAGINNATTVLLAECAENSQRVSYNEIPLVPPFAMRLPAATVTASVSSDYNSDGSVTVDVQTDKTALYVVLTTLAQGRFSENAFAMAPGNKTLQFLPFPGAQLDLKELRASLRVEHLQQHVTAVPEMVVLM